MSKPAEVPEVFSGFWRMGELDFDQMKFRQEGSFWTPS